MFYGCGDITVQSNSSHLSHCLAWLGDILGNAEAFEIDKHTIHYGGKRTDESVQGIPNVFRAGIWASCPRITSSI